MPAAPTVPDRFHRQVLGGLDLQHQSEAVAAEGLPCRLAGGNESERHGVELGPRVAARTRNIRKAVHLSSVERLFGPFGDASMLTAPCKFATARVRRRRWCRRPD